MRNPRLLAMIALALCSLFAFSAVAEAATKKRGVQRRYAGAQWSAPGPKGGFYAKLRLDSAGARDTRRGGYIAQTLWAQTNEGKTPYGKNVDEPYLQVAVSRGYRGRGGNHIVAAVRTAGGRYFEDRSGGPAVKYGQDYAFSLVSQVGGVWTISLGPDQLAEVKGMGDKFGSLSAYAGLESTSSRNSAKGRVSDLGRLEVTGKAAAFFPEWNFGGDEYHARLIKRGPGSARWVDRDYELVNSFGP